MQILAFPSKNSSGNNNAFPNLTGREDSGPQPLCHQEDGRAGHARHRPPDGQRLAAQVRPQDRRKARVLQPYARPYHHVTRLAGEDRASELLFRIVTGSPVLSRWF